MDINFRSSCSITRGVKHVRDGAHPNTRNRNDFVSKVYEFGVPGPDYIERGNLSLSDAPRPSLIIGKPQNAYLIDKQMLTQASNLQIEKNWSSWLFSGLKQTVTYSAVAMGINFLVAPFSIVSTVAGAAVGLFIAGANLLDVYVRSRQVFSKSELLLETLNDMVSLAQTGRTKSWMNEARSTQERRSLCPAAFDQASTELSSLNVALPWASELPAVNVLAGEVSFPAVPETRPLSRPTLRSAA